MTLQHFGESGHCGAVAHKPAEEDEQERECAALGTLVVVVATKKKCVKDLAIWKQVITI